MDWSAIQKLRKRLHFRKIWSFKEENEILLITKLMSQSKLPTTSECLNTILKSIGAQ